jgi:hypothetical protein
MQSTMLIVGLWLGLAGAPLAWAAAGDVDPSFGFPRPTAPEPDPTTAVASPDGYLVIRSAQSAVADPQPDSTLEVVRIDLDGNVVDSFGDGGTATSLVPGPTQLAEAAARQSNGSILIGGHRTLLAGQGFDTRAAVARLHADGTLDQAFGTDGVASLDVPGDLDRVAGVAQMPDGRIAVLVWSRLEVITWDCDYHDRATLLMLDADGQTASETAFTERNGYAVSSCRTALTLQALPDGTVLYGSEVGVSDGVRLQTGVNFRYGPFAMDTALGLIVGEVQGSGINVPFTTQVAERTGYWRDIGWAAGYDGAITWHTMAVDAQRSVVYVGFSTDGGQAGVARFLLDGSIDTSWSQDGIATIEGSGRPDVTSDYGLAADVRMIHVQADGSIVVATGDGIVERLTGGSGSAHGAFVVTSSQVVAETQTIAVNVLREGGSQGVTSVEYSIVSCDSLPGEDCSSTQWLRPATAGVDFEVASGRLDWAEGDSTPRTLTVRTLQDGQLEPDEYFHVQLSNPSGGATVISAPLALIIEDSGVVDTGPVVQQPVGGGNSGGGGLLDVWAVLFLLLAALLRLALGLHPLKVRSARRSRVGGLHPAPSRAGEAPRDKMWRRAMTRHERTAHP